MVKGFLVPATAAAALALCALAWAAPAPVPTPRDAEPYWTRDGRTVAFDRTDPRTGAVDVFFTPAVRGAETDIVGAGSVRGFRPGGDQLLVAQGADVTAVRDVEARQLAAVRGHDATWSPDGMRIAFVRDGTLYVSDAAGNAAVALVPGVAEPAADRYGPVWSPDGTEIAVASGWDIVVAPADGGEATVAFHGTADVANPAWSPDGRTIAFERHDAGQATIWAVGPDGSDPRQLVEGAGDDRFPQYGPGGDRIAYISDREHLPGITARFQYALYVQALAGPAIVKLVDDVDPDSPARFSPAGAQLAVSAAQECRRFGIYVVPSGARKPVRRSNQCRFDGGAGADDLVGTPYRDFMRGFAGNDYLVASAGDDRIDAGPGKDRVAAGPGNDQVLGGPGDDILSGGTGDDVIRAGPGADLVGCGPGNDTVYVSADDRVNRDCEHVHRS